MPNGTFLRSKQTVTVGIDFCNWLTTHGATLAELNQPHMDAWQAEGPTTREFVSRFINWTAKAKITTEGITAEPHRRGTSPRLPAAEQGEAIDRVVHHDDFSPRDRLAAILILVSVRASRPSLP
ncbi:hypothetical protein [Paenarthrobacter sp. PH39-S1]|uniref:hypothetical protein n=1 Tax=Paenarthrobacter sp. PH39-S1 TaxID=3046204 RepID=UPI0024B89810|nr:hypothetical protein [Paenarthrobacter sp. PH39-S1]MDJ0358126.1 hypothetical protein [Paenarthrobacter sp. PH39-S1]